MILKSLTVVLSWMPWYVLSSRRGYGPLLGVGPLEKLQGFFLIAGSFIRLNDDDGRHFGLGQDGAQGGHDLAVGENDLVDVLLILGLGRGRLPVGEAAVRSEDKGMVGQQHVHEDELGPFHLGNFSQKAELLDDAVAGLGEHERTLGQRVENGRFDELEQKFLVEAEQAGALKVEVGPRIRLGRLVPRAEMDVAVAEGLSVKPSSAAPFRSDPRWKRPIWTSDSTTRSRTKVDRIETSGARSLRVRRTSTIRRTKTRIQTVRRPTTGNLGLFRSVVRTKFRKWPAARTRIVPPGTGYFGEMSREKRLPDPASREDAADR